MSRLYHMHKNIYIYFFSYCLYSIHSNKVSHIMHRCLVYIMARCSPLLHHENCLVVSIELPISDPEPKNECLKFLPVALYQDDEQFEPSYHHGPNFHMIEIS